ncbi:hypothetical protein BaRGS_00037155, partial [Batillaria attramentaria]
RQCNRYRVPVKRRQFPAASLPHSMHTLHRPRDRDLLYVLSPPLLHRRHISEVQDSKQSTADYCPHAGNTATLLHC